MTGIFLIKIYNKGRPGKTGRSCFFCENVNGYNKVCFLYYDRCLHTKVVKILLSIRKNEAKN